MRVFLDSRKQRVVGRGSKQLIVISKENNGVIVVMLLARNSGK